MIIWITGKSRLIYMLDGKLWKGTEYEEPDHEEIMVKGYNI